MAPTARELFSEFRRTGDGTLLASVFDATAPKLLALAIQLTREVDEAEDLVQATFLAAIEGAARYDEDRALLPWLSGILSNLAHEQLRRRQRERPTRRAAPPDPVDPALASERAEARLTVRRELASLPDAYRTALILKYECGLTAVQIAHALGESPGAVRIRIHRGRELLRRALPAGLTAAAVGWLSAGRGLAAVRAAVLGPAMHRAPWTLIGVWLTMKKWIGVAALVVVALCAALFGAGWFGDRPDPVAPGSERTEAAVAASVDTPPSAPEARSAVPDVAASAAAEPSAGALEVWVTSEGRPVPSAAVFVETRDGRDPELHRRRAVTGSAGVVTFESVPAGAVRVFSDRPARADVEVVAGAVTRCRLDLDAHVTVRGEVVDAAGTPVAGAGIWATVSTFSFTVEDDLLGQELTTTDADGRFELRAMTIGQFLGARCAGYAPSRMFYLSNLTISGRELEVRLVLPAAGATLTGRVVDAGDVPIAGARVLVGPRLGSADGSLPAGSKRQPVKPIGLRTDADGRFVAAGVALGATPVRVRAAGRAPALRVVDVTPAGAECVFRLARGARVHGRVVDGAGTPLRRVEVEAFGLAAYTRAAVLTDAAGRYRLDGLAVGPCRIRFASYSHEPVQRSLRLDPGETRTLEVSLREPPVTTGILEDVAGEPLQAWEVRARRVGSRSSTRVMTDGRGRFAFESARDASYELFLRAPESEGFFPCPEVGPIAAGDDVVVVVDDAFVATGFVTGALVDAGGAGVGAVLTPLAAGLGAGDVFARYRSADSGGRFRCGPLPPGRYTMRVVPTRVDQPAFVAGPFEVGPGGLDLGVLTLAAHGEVVVRLSRRDGGAVEERRVEVWRGAELVRRLDGSRVALPVGDYRLRVSARGCQPDVTEFAVVAGRTTELDRELAAGTRCELRFPAADVAGWPSTGAVAYVLRAGTEVIARGTVAVEPDWPARVSVDLGIGSYRLDVSTGDGTSFSGSFTVDALEPRFEPVLVDLAPAGGG